jgi:hypothetical protein
MRIDTVNDETAALYLTLADDTSVHVDVAFTLKALDALARGESIQIDTGTASGQMRVLAITVINNAKLKEWLSSKAGGRGAVGGPVANDLER